MPNSVRTQGLNASVFPSLAGGLLFFALQTTPVERNIFFGNYLPNKLDVYLTRPNNSLVRRACTSVHSQSVLTNVTGIAALNCTVVAGYVDELIVARSHDYRPQPHLKRG